MLQEDCSQPAECGGNSENCGSSSGRRYWLDTHGYDAIGCGFSFDNCCSVRPVPAAPLEFNCPENLILSFVLG